MPHCLKSFNLSFFTVNSRKKEELSIGDKKMSDTIKTVLVFIAAFMLFCTSHSVLADEAPTKAGNCKKKEMFTLSLQYMNSLKKDTDFGNYFKTKLALINEIAKKHKISPFKIVSQDMSIGPGSYDSNAVDVSISLSIEVSLDYKAINYLYLESKAYAASVSYYSPKECDNGR
jgi:hypothetical protein